MADASKIAKSNVARSKSHERRVAKLLAAWTGQDFRRRRVTGRDTATRMVEATADVIALHTGLQFSVEAKCGRGFSLDSLLALPATSLFTSWWHQTCYDAGIASQDLGYRIYPLLFFKPIPAQDWVGVSRLAFEDGVLRPRSGGPATPIWFPHLRYDWFAQCGPVEGDVSHTKNKRLVPLQLDPVVLCRWRDFEVAVDPAGAFREDTAEAQDGMQLPTAPHHNR